MPSDLQPGAVEDGVRQNFQKRIGPGNDQVQHRPGAAVSVAAESAAEKGKTDVAPAHSTLDYDKGFQFGQTMEGMNQDVG
jgi:hypothetical protein